METNKICAFFGKMEQELTDEQQRNISKFIEDLILMGYSRFHFGGFSYFDSFCYDVVGELKNKYQQIERYVCNEDPFNLKINNRHKILTEETCNNFIFATNLREWWENEVPKRNCKIVDGSDLIIFFINENETSYANTAYNYAKQIKKQVVNLFN